MFAWRILYAPRQTRRRLLLLPAVVAPLWEVLQNVYISIALQPMVFLIRASTPVFEAGFIHNRPIKLFAAAIV